MSAVGAPARRRVRVRVQGTVQGVGFRPYVYRLAAELALGGFVLNDAAGVLIEIEGDGPAVDDFLARLPRQAPPLAHIAHVGSEPLPPSGESAFTIAPSAHSVGAEPSVGPDSATCPRCLSELRDPGDRRFRYPFINCTDCGPRFTLVRGVPYDRPLTTMAGFVMCAQCQGEYDDPSDRRFHAQPNACPRCGPALTLLDAGGTPVPRAVGEDAVAAAAAALRRGQILAVKGIGGYHLACAADNERAVATLRARKHREDKPFALMTPDIASAGRLVEIGAQEQALLQSAARPIVLAHRRPGAPVAAAVAPGCPELGVMLPYSPVHHLLLADAGTPLVMTSGNVSDEPIAYRDEDALARLGAIADLLLVGDRPIHTRTDDSVVRVMTVAGRPRSTLMRRSRGYVPAALPLPAAGAHRPLLACGAELKSTFTVARGTHAWVSHHIGDLENYETLVSFTEGVEHFCRLFDVVPELIAHDLHPEYLSTKYALDRVDVEPVAVQHHHAHLAACLAEHGRQGPAVGAIFDGSGYGDDGTLWGGEILYGDLRCCERIGALVPVRLPGGERAIRQPWRMACAWLTAVGVSPEPMFAGRVDAAALVAVAKLLDTGLASPWTTSMGRLFDAVAAICGVRLTVNYEGQAAIELEASCELDERGRYPIAVEPAHGRVQIDPRETLRAVAADVRAGVPVARIASRFHATVAAATVEACVWAAAQRATETVVLSGGVFANRRLLESVSTGLTEAGLQVLAPERLPAGDGGISYGQAAVAAAKTAA